MPLLQTTDLQFRYPNQAMLHFPDLQAQSGESWLILGQSGCGKTTLLHLLAGLLRPTSGSVSLLQTDLAQLSATQLDRFRGKNIGMVFQKTHFVGALTVSENLALAQQLAGVAPNADSIRELLVTLRLDHKRNSSTARLSQGEQQRVAIARALINSPALILADEPTSALDDTNCQQVIELLETQAAEANALLVIVTHDARLKDFIPRRIELTAQHHESAR